MGENYTADEYREVLMAVQDMNGDKRKEAFDKNKCFSDYIKDFPASELIEKYRAYKNIPQIGEYWKDKKNGEMIVIRRIEENVVYIYYCDGGYNNSFSYKYFVGNFVKTEHKSQYLEAFLEEMKEVSK